MVNGRTFEQIEGVAFGAQTDHFLEPNRDTFWTILNLFDRNLKILQTPNFLNTSLIFDYQLCDIIERVFITAKTLFTFHVILFFTIYLKVFKIFKKTHNQTRSELPVWTKKSVPFGHQKVTRLGSKSVPFNLLQIDPM